MEDRDSFYYRAICTELGSAFTAQHNLNAPLSEPLKLDEAKGLDLDNPEQRRRHGYLENDLSRLDRVPFAALAPLFGSPI
jgi:hypothetical protein